MSIKSGKVILMNHVHGDWPIGHKTVAESGVYDALLIHKGQLRYNS